MEKAISILHLENLSADADRIAAELRQLDPGFRITRVTDRSGYTKALAAVRPDIVISELILPDIDAETALRLLRQQSSFASFVIITSPANEKTAAGMFKYGIDDYILKNHLARLPSVIHRAVERVIANIEKQRHSAELTSRELRFQALLENSHETILVADENLRITYRSPSSVRITGFSLAELDKISLMQRIHPDDEDKLQQFFGQVRATPGKHFKTIVRAMHKRGDYIRLSVIATNLLQDRNVNGIVINYSDVSEHVKTEQELIRTGNHFKALLENISDAIILLNSEGLVQYQSPSVERTTGFSPEKMMNRSIFEFLYPDDVARGREYFRAQLAQEGASESHIFRMMHASGKYIWVEGTHTNLLDDESVNAIVINFHDISERRQSENLLRKSEANLRTIFENTNNAYLLIDKRYNVISYNHLARKRYLNELKIELHEGLNIVRAMPENRQEEARINFGKVLEGEKISYEINFRQEEGHFTWYDIDILPVRDNFGNILGLIISSEDITARKLIELERDKMTSDIMQHNKDLEQFAYIISHNLRSPVANIIGLTNLVRGPVPLSENDFNRCMDGLKTTALKLDEIISDLNFILQARRAITETMENVAFPDLLQDIQTLLQDMIQREDIRISSDFEVKTLFTVRSYMHSIFLNLIINSIKYRKPEGHTLIGVSSRQIANMVQLRFSDNGTGIDLNAHGDKIFGLYKKFHNHIDGKGMGLYMVKTQVEMLGGRIRVESKVNTGTEFIIEFGKEDE